MTPPAVSPITVLVVEDDDDTSVLLGVLLRRQGWNTVFAPDLVEARRALATGDVSALVTDISLPDGRGLSLLADGRPASLRAALVISGRVAEDERKESLRQGFDACFVKPFDSAALVAFLAGLLAPPPAHRSASRTTPTGLA